MRRSGGNHCRNNRATDGSGRQQREVGGRSAGSRHRGAGDDLITVSLSFVNQLVDNLTGCLQLSVVLKKVGDHVFAKDQLPGPSSALERTPRAVQRTRNECKPTLLVVLNSVNAFDFFVAIRTNEVAVLTLFRVMNIQVSSSHQVAATVVWAFDNFIFTYSDIAFRSYSSPLT
jgi:hypothetical protein